jgi:non-canonical (house-cleaning) NTP pyrophosphatase
MLEKLKSGKESGKFMNELTRRIDVQRREGAIGIIIKERLTESLIYQVCAFVNLYKTLF